MSHQNARERILQAAVKIFAEKSFEGARIEEVAREANVPKSLIYYHFKNKEDILEVLTNNFIEEYLLLINSTLDESHVEKAQGLEERMKSVYYEFGIRNADLVRVMLIDSLKKTKEQPIFFKIIDAMIAKEMAHKNDTDYDVHERRIAEFFTSFLPNFAYICFKDAWTKYFEIDSTQFNGLYLKVYGETHGAYHKNHP